MVRAMCGVLLKDSDLLGLNKIIDQLAMQTVCAGMVISLECH